MITKATTIAGQDPSCPIYGPTMKIRETGEICELVHYTKDLVFRLRMKDGSLKDFTRQELD